MSVRKSCQVKARVARELTRAQIAEMDQRIQAAFDCSQRDVAKQMGVSHTYLHLLECGKRPITAEVAAKFRNLAEWFAGEILERGVIIIADFDVPDKIQLFSNGRWKRI